jgi:transposase InsO family protein
MRTPPRRVRRCDSLMTTRSDRNPCPRSRGNLITRAIGWFASHGVTVERVMIDNALNYRRSQASQAALTATGTRHLRTRPYRPQTNGKAERLNQTLLREWAYDQPYTSNQQRLDSLQGWLHDYNWHRLHTELDGPPASRLPVNNVCVKDS